MDAAAALTDLLELSSQVERAVLLGSDGAIAAASEEGERAERLAAAARDLLAAAAPVVEAGARTLTQLEVALPEGSVFVVRDRDRVIAATTAPQPAPGLVLYDLRTCLRAAESPKRKSRAKKAAAADA